MRKWCVIGCSGFLGKNLLRHLLDQGRTVTGVDLVAPGIEHPDLRFRAGSFQDPAVLAEALAGTDVVVHLASTVTPASSNANMLRDIQDNLGGGVALLQGCLAAGVKKVVFISSGGTVYGPGPAEPLQEDTLPHPLCSYGIVKLAMEHYAQLFARLHGLDSTVLRLSNPFGPHQNAARGQGFIAAVLNNVLTGKPTVIWGDGSVVRDFIYVDDVSEAIYRAGCHLDSERFRLLNIGSGHGLSLNEVVEAISASCAPVEVRYEAGRAFDVPYNVLDIGRARRTLDWAPAADFRQSLTRTWQWMATQQSRPA